MDFNEISQGLVISLATQYPVVTSILVIMGTAAAINKPLFALAKAYVAKTESKRDDEILVQIETSKFYKALSFVLDWSLSIKLPKKVVAVPIEQVEEKKTA